MGWVFGRLVNCPLLLWNCAVRSLMFTWERESWCNVHSRGGTHRMLIFLMQWNIVLDLAPNHSWQMSITLFCYRVIGLHSMEKDPSPHYICGSPQVPIYTNAISSIWPTAVTDAVWPAVSYDTDTTKYFGGARLRVCWIPVVGVDTQLNTYSLMHIHYSYRAALWLCYIFVSQLPCSYLAWLIKEISYMHF